MKSRDEVQSGWFVVTRTKIRVVCAPECLTELLATTTSLNFLPKAVTGYFFKNEIRFGVGASNSGVEEDETFLELDFVCISKHSWNFHCNMIPTFLL